MTPSEKYIKSMEAQKKAPKAGLAQTEAPPPAVGTPSPTNSPAGSYSAAVKKARQKGSPSLSPANTDPEENPWDAIQTASTGLKGLSDADKIERKKALLEQFLPGVMRLLEANSQGPAEASRVLVWLGDVGRMEEFLRLSTKAIKLGWASPFATDWPELRLYVLCKWAEGQVKSGGALGVNFDYSMFENAMKMVENTPNAHAKLKARMYKVAGQVAMKKAEHAQANEMFSKALEYDANCGCKGLLKEAMKNLDAQEKSAELVAEATAPHGQAVPIAAST